MKVVSFQQIGDSLGVSKQAVDKLFVKTGFLRKNKKGKIDIDDPYNREFLEEKEANFAVFGAVKELKVIQKPPEMPKKPEVIPEKVLKIETKSEKENTLGKIEKMLKIEQIKGRQKDNELKTLKIMEAKGDLLPKKIIDQLIEDYFHKFNEMLLTKPKSIAGDIIAEVKAGNVQSLVRLLQKSYMDENKKLLDNAKKRYVDAINNKIKEVEEENERPQS